MANAKDKAPAASTEDKANGRLWSDKFGRVDASVWQRDFQGKLRHSVSLSRSYRDKGGEWQRTSFFDESDADDLQEAIAAAIAFLQSLSDEEAA